MNMQNNKGFAFVKKDIYKIQMTIQLLDAKHMNVHMPKFMKLKRLF